MPFAFVGQPFPGTDQIGTILGTALRDPAYTHAWIATAWAKQSGLSRLAAALATFRQGGGRIEGIVGVDEGGATVEGLRLAARLFTSAHVFHDPGARTFHAKIYVVQNDARAVAVIGSGNLTQGGLYTNSGARRFRISKLRRRRPSSSGCTPRTTSGTPDSDPPHRKARRATTRPRARRPHARRRRAHGPGSSGGSD
jgi:hypothetical protein